MAVEFLSALGVLNLATLRMSVRALDPGHPRVDPVSFDDVKDYVAQAAQAVVEMLRAHGVVGRFVEFYGSGLDSLTLADRGHEHRLPKAAVEDRDGDHQQPCERRPANHRNPPILEDGADSRPSLTPRPRSPQSRHNDAKRRRNIITIRCRALV